jgi:hypothetical protein
VSAFRPFLFPPVGVFSRPPLAPQPNLCASGASSFLSITWRLLVSLCSLFRARFLYFHELAASFSKMPGGLFRMQPPDTGWLGGYLNPRHALLPPSYAPRGTSIPCGLTRLRILPVTTGVDYSLRQFRNRGFFLCVSVPLWEIPFCLSFVFTTIRIAFPAIPLFSQPSALPRGVGYAVAVFTLVPSARGSAYRNMTGCSHLVDNRPCGLGEPVGSRMRGA